MLNVLNKFFKIIDAVLKTVVVLIVAAFIVIVFAQVIARYVFNNSLSWSEELARILFTQMIFLTAPIAVNEKKHIAVDIVVQYLPRGAKRWLYVFINAISFVFFCFLAVSGYKFMLGNVNQTTAALQISMGILYAAVPISSVLMAINCIRAGIDDYCNVYAPKKEVKS